MSKAFDKISAGLEDAIAFAQGDGSRGRVARPIDVRAIRIATNKTQKEFAEAYGLPVGTVRDWEQNRRQPDAPARVLLSLIEAEPGTVENLIAKNYG
jgi:putative transcriptional regulator